jgi:FKBP-type peptidyl-prolyl cis-trans isomerase FkpA
MLKKQLAVGLAFACALGMAACKKDGETSSGLSYTFRKDVKKDSFPVSGDYVEINYELYVTTKSGKDSLLQTSLNTPGPDRMMVRDTTAFKGGFEEGFKLMNAGDSISLIVSADSLFLKQFRQPELPPFVAAGSKARLEVGLIKIITKAEVEKIMDEQEKAYREKMKQMQEQSEKQKPLEEQKIKDYLAKNSIKNAKNADSGLYYVIKSAGKGDNIKQGDTVSVMYTGTLLENGEKFDSNVGKDPLVFAVQAGMMIPGFDEGMTFLKEGGKADLYLPSHLGYGGQGSPPTIQPFATLKFEVEVVKVKRAKK